MTKIKYDIIKQVEGEAKQAILRDLNEWLKYSSSCYPFLRKYGQKYISESLVSIPSIEIMVNQIPITKQKIFSWAATCLGCPKLVKILISSDEVTPEDNNDLTFRWACTKGKLDVVRILLKDARINPAADNNSSIKWACRNGHLDVVKLLLQDDRVDPSANQYSALRGACEKNHYEIVSLLLSHKKIQQTLDPKTLLAFYHDANAEVKNQFSNALFNKLPPLLVHGLFSVPINEKQVENSLLCPDVFRKITNLYLNSF